MLPKKHRLSKSAEVKKTTATGRSFFNPFFVIKMAKSMEPAKVTVIVSTRVSKKAVVRNRIKRVIRDVLGRHIKTFPSGTYAFIVKPKSATISSAELTEQVLSSLRGAKLAKI